MDNKNIAKKTGRIIRATRKQLGKTQIDMARALGISQGGLSKLESGILVPTAPVWIHFCEMTSVSPMSLKTGVLDRESVAKLRSDLHENGFEVPTRYRMHRGSKGREMLPVLRFLEEKLGDRQLREHFKQLGMDPDFFVSLDNQVNINFFIDALKTLVQKKLLSAEDLTPLTRVAKDPDSHGSLHRIYDGHSGARELVHRLLGSVKRYECNFSYAIEDETENSMEIAVKPEDHMADFEYRNDPDLGDLLCRYKKGYLEGFMAYGGEQGWVVEEKECLFHGAARCLYHLRRAS